jgi:hypothetical protein
MRGQFLWACVAALSLTAAGARAQEYTIKLKHFPDPGKSVVVKDTDEKEATLKVTDPDGKKVQDQKQSEKADEVYTETVLEKGDKSPKKYKRTYEKATRTRDGKAEARSYEGRTLHFEEKDGKYTVTAEGDKPLAKEDLDELTRKANEGSAEQEEAFLPKKPVKVGDTWKVEGKEVAKVFAKDGELDPDLTSVEGKLTKVYKEGDHQFGVLTLTLKVAPKPKFPPTFKAEKPPVVESTVTFDVAIDGSTTKGTMTMTGNSGLRGTDEQMGKKFGVEQTVKLSGKREQSPEK